MTRDPQKLSQGSCHSAPLHFMAAPSKLSCWTCVRLAFFSLTIPSSCEALRKSGDKILGSDRACPSSCALQPHCEPNQLPSHLSAHLPLSRARQLEGCTSAHHIFIRCLEYLTAPVRILALQDLRDSTKLQANTECHQACVARPVKF